MIELVCWQQTGAVDGGEAAIGNQATSTHQNCGNQIRSPGENIGNQKNVRHLSLIMAENHIQAIMLKIFLSLFHKRFVFKQAVNFLNIFYK